MRTRRTAAGPPVDEAVLWHDVECGAYGADLPLWGQLGQEREGPTLELGCGTGRVTLDLARLGHDVTGLDSDPALVDALARRARERGLRVRTQVGDARSFDAERSFALAIAPMQVVQLLGGPAGRDSMLACVRRQLASGGLLAVALADPLEGVSAASSLPPLPDVREEEGWVFSSTPVAVRPEPDGVAVDRLRETVSPAGKLWESVTTVRLDLFPPAELESAAERLGYRVLERRLVPETGPYVGSTVCMLEAA